MYFYCLILLLIIPTFLVAETNSYNELDYVFEHLSRYPFMEASDFYKLVYQAEMGPAHWGVDKEKILKYLTRECSSLDTIDAENIPIVEPIGNRYVRIHLVPYLKQGYSIENLADVFYASMQQPVTLDRFKTIWSRLIKISEHKTLGNVSTEEFIELDSLAFGKGYPPAHHSDTYKARYAPHYRVIAVSLADSLLVRLSNN